jgi:DNA-directed RNA polymerase subunit H (RpoH/RPB5)
MNKHHILSDEELKMLLSNDDTSNNTGIKISNDDTTFKPRSTRHRKKKGWFWNKTNK